MSSLCPVPLTTAADCSGRSNAGGTSDAEIHHRSPPVPVNHDVLRFQIAMDDTLRMGGLKTAANLENDLGGLFRIEFAALPKHRVQLASFDVLHADEAQPARDAQVVNPHHVPMRHLASQHQFLLEALDDNRIVRQFLANNLDGDQTIEFQIASLVHGTHAALAEFLEESRTCSPKLRRGSDVWSLLSFPPGRRRSSRVHETFRQERRPARPEDCGSLCKRVASSESFAGDAGRFDLRSPDRRKERSASPDRLQSASSAPQVEQQPSA